MELHAVVEAAVDVGQEVLRADRRFLRVQFDLDLAEVGGEQYVGRFGGQQAGREEQGAGGHGEFFQHVWISCGGWTSAVVLWVAVAIGMPAVHGDTAGSGLCAWRSKSSLRMRVAGPICRSLLG
ncbi:hypothetical protein D3C78_762600 [compost metagenome]